MIAIANGALGRAGADTFRVAAGLLTLPNGNVTVQNVDGTVMSVQPGGAIESRPAGSAGGYEQARASGTLVTFHPIAPGHGLDDPPYVFLCAELP
jgi:hypothetical protein